MEQVALEQLADENTDATTKRLAQSVLDAIPDESINEPASQTGFTTI